MGDYLREAYIKRELEMEKITEKQKKEARRKNLLLRLIRKIKRSKKVEIND